MFLWFLSFFSGSSLCNCSPWFPRVFPGPWPFLHVVSPALAGAGWPWPPSPRNSRSLARENMAGMGSVDGDDHCCCCWWCWCWCCCDYSHYWILLPVVPHKAVAEVSKIRNLQERLVVCESRMAERIHWWTERWLELCFLERLQWLQWSPGRSPHPQLLDVASCSAAVVVVVA